ncbi:MAG: restriction endonuclease subunit S [Burkholderiaceae bacterium]
MGWQWRPLTDLARLESGHTPSRRHPEYWGGTIPWLSIPDAKKHHGGAIETTDNSTNDLGIANSSARLLPAGTVCLSRTASVGYVVVTATPMATSQDFVNWICGDELEPRFLQYLLIAEGTELLRFASGAVHKTIYFPEVKAFHVCVPSVSEQQRIVAILDEAFEAIATAKANAEKNLQNVPELFDSQLVAILSDKGEAWPRKTLQEVATDFGRGKSKHRPRNDPKLYEGPFPFIQTGDVRNSNHLITRFTQTYSEEGLAQSKLWPKGTLCITIAANIAETGVLDFDACFPDSVIGVVVDPGQTTSKYVEYMLRTVKADLKAKGKGSAQDNINLATFENERFAFPDISTQASMVERLDELSFEVKHLESMFANKLTALDELKKSLLHQAFTGQL